LPVTSEGEKLPRFHAEATRSGAEWLIYVRELEQSIIVRSRDEIIAKACDLIKTKSGTTEEQIELVLRSERDIVRARADRLGFETICDSGSRTDTFPLPGKRRGVSVRYDDYGAVVAVDASTQVAEFPATRDGACEALFYTAQYSDIRRRHLRKRASPEAP
jgi:hypothetical protein